MNQYKNQKGEYPKNPKEAFSNKMTNKTIKYQRKYKFEIGENNSTWNNEADAFKHTYMQAYLSLRTTEQIAKIIGDDHEKKGGDRGQPSGEENMDKWNNQQGREIANEIIKEYGIIAKTYNDDKLGDIIAEKINQRMKEGKLITNPNDKRKFEERENKTFTRQDIEKMTPEEFAQNEKEIFKQMGKGEISNEKPDYSKYKNPLTGKDKIYSKEEVDKMSNAEYEKHEQEIMAQINKIGLPNEKDIPKQASTSSAKGKSSNSSTNNSNSSENGKWVTIDGNHVLIKE